MKKLFNFSFKNLFNKNTLKQETVLRINNNYGYTTWLKMLPDPDPVLFKLGKDKTVLKELLSDDHLSSCITRRKMGVKSMEWRIIKHERTTENELSLINNAINLLIENGCRIKDLISSSLNPILWGYSVFEIIWVNNNGYWLPKSFSEKPREWFYFDDNNCITYKPNNSQTAINLTQDKYKFKFILLQNEPSFENPYGEKALSKCFWPVTFKKGGLKFWSVFVEKYGMPFILAKQPRSIDNDNSINLLNKLENMVQDAIAVIPDDSSVEFKESKGNISSDVYERFINQQNNAISKAILTNVFSTEYQSNGGYATAKSGLESEKLLAKEDKDFAEQLFNTLFKYIIELNTGNKYAPQFKLFEEDEAKKDFAERDALLTNNISFNKQYYHRVYNIPLNEFELKQDE